MSGKVSTTNTSMIQAPVGAEISSRLQMAIKKGNETGRPFFVITIQIENLKQFAKRHDQDEVNKFLQGMYYAVRASVHQNQFVAVFREGLTLIFEGGDVGQVDTVARRLVGNVQKFIVNGRYNSTNDRWTDIIYHFLNPTAPLMFPLVGWSIYPRDGVTGPDLVSRALHHGKENYERARAA